MTKANAGADEGGLVPFDAVPTAAFFRGFDESLPPTPENRTLAVQRLNEAGSFMGGIMDDFVLWAGRVFLWLRQATPHGEWLPFLKAEFPSLEPRKVQRWMFVAKYYLRHGRRPRSKVTYLAEGDPALDDPDLDEKLADPEAEVESYADVKRERDRLKKGRAAFIERDVKSQEALREKEDEIARLKKGDSWQEEERRCPIRFLLARAHLCVTEANALIEQATDADLVRQADGDVGLLGGILSATQRDLEELIIQHKHRLGSSLKSHMDPD